MSDIERFLPFLKNMEENGMINYPAPVSYDDAMEMISYGFAKIEWEYQGKKTTRGGLVLTLKGKLFLKESE